MEEDLKQLELYMMNKVNRYDLVEVNKVKRYIKIVSVMRELEKCLEEQGVTTEVKNGSQEFVKSNPALKEWNNLNKTLMTLEKTLALGSGDFETEKATSIDGLRKLMVNAKE